LTDTFSTATLSRACMLSVDSLTECGRVWLEAHRLPRSYGFLPGYFVAPYFDLAQGFSERSDPQYQPFHSLTRTEPALQFNGVAPNVITVIFHLMAESVQYNLTALREAAAWLSDLNQPSYSVSGKRYAPPKVRVLVGNVFNMDCVVEQVALRYVGPWSNNPDGDPYPHGIDVSLTFVTVPSAFQNFAGGADGEAPSFRTGARDA